MNRTATSFFLSAAFHATALFAASHAWHGNPVPPPAVMRVTLSAPAKTEITSAAQVVSLPKIETAVPRAIQKIAPLKKEVPRKPADKPVPKKTKPAVKTAPASLAQPEEQPASQPEQALAESEATGGFEETAQPSGESQASAGFAPTPAGRAIFDASSLRVMKKVAPDYPMISRKRKESGTVVLLIEISSGSVGSVEVESSSGHTPLDESAVRAVKMWKFDAGHGNAILARIPFKFDIKHKITAP
jgi:protein TonB